MLTAARGAVSRSSPRVSGLPSARASGLPDSPAEFWSAAAGTPAACTGTLPSCTKRRRIRQHPRPLDNPGDAARLLYSLQEAGAQEQAAALLARL